MPVVPKPPVLVVWVVWVVAAGVAGLGADLAQGALQEHVAVVGRTVQEGLGRHVAEQFPQFVELGQLRAALPAPGEVLAKAAGLLGVERAQREGAERGAVVLGRAHRATSGSGPPIAAFKARRA